MQSNLEEFNLTEIQEEINNISPAIFAVSLKQAEIEKPIISKRNDYVTWGENNCFFNTLLQSVDKAPIQNTAIEYKSSLFAGENYRIVNQNELTESEISQVNIFLNNINGDGDDLQSLLRKACYDLCLTGNMYLQPIWSKNKQKISEIYHVHANTLAPQKVDAGGRINGYYFSSDWSQSRRSEYTPIYIPAFSTIDRSGRQIIPMRLNHRTGGLYFGMPDYLASLPLIDLTKEIFMLWLSFVRRGCFTSLAVNFNQGIPTPEIQKKIIADFKKMYEGEDRAHTFFTFNNSKDTTTTFQNLNAGDLDKTFNTIQGIIESALLTSHRIPTKLMGASNIGNGTNISSKEDIINSWQILMGTVVHPVHVRLEKIINRILSINGWSAKIEIVDNTPIQMLDYAADLTSDERRALMGYEPITKDPNAEVSLVSTLGVGGLQSLTAIIQSPVTNEQKLAMLVNVFGIEKQKAIEIVAGIPLTN